MKRLLSEKSSNDRSAFNRRVSRSGGFAATLRDHRFIISCVAVAVLAAVVIATVLSSGKATQTAALNGGERSAAADGVTGTLPPVSDTPAPTTDADAVRQFTEGKEGEDARSAGIQSFRMQTGTQRFGSGVPMQTEAPYVDIITEVPEITPKAITASNAVLVEYGEHSELIPAVQERLMVLWYMDQDEPTDYLGRVTTAALEVFQRRNDIPVTGKLNSRTYKALFDLTARSYLCSFGDTGSDVEFIQERLYELDYLKEKSGSFDDETLEAVKAFQQANGLDVDGKVGRNTKEALYSPDATPMMLGRGDYGDSVLVYQKRLQELGYLTTEPDGVFGVDTQMAVKRFQAQNQLVVDGNLGPSTREKLMDPDAAGNALSYSMHGSDVMNVQTRLYELNYLRAQDVNSYFTSITEQAVRLFQRNNGLDVDGKVGKFTMKKLMSDDAVRASAPVSSNSGNSGGNNGGGNSGGGNNGGGNSGGGNSGGGNNGGGNNGGGNVQARINNFISIARSKLGCRYVRGGKGPNVFDCSGFVYWCMNKAGINQSYMTSYMWRSCTRYPRNNNINNVKKGDVIVYYGHVAICSGSWTHIDASQSNGKVVERSFNRSYWHRNFICSFRVFN